MTTQTTERETFKKMLTLALILEKLNAAEIVALLGEEKAIKFLAIGVKNLESLNKEERTEVMYELVKELMHDLFGEDL